MTNDRDVLCPDAAPRRRHAAWRAGLVVWLIAVAVGIAHLEHYGSAPGQAAAPRASWPVDTGLARGSRPTLVCFVHPRCPCTRSTLAELARALGTSRTERLDAHVLVLQPASRDPRWSRTDLWRSAAAIPGVRVVADVDGREARRFGARTSGETQLFGARGARLFAGGITPGRGHEGDCAGRRAVVALAAGRPLPCAATPVYGCPLFGDETPSVPPCDCGTRGL